METSFAHQSAESLHRSTSSPSWQHSNRDSHTELINSRTLPPLTDGSPPPPPLVSPLPHNAIVFQSSRSPHDPDTSFRGYIDHQFPQDATALKTHLGHGGTTKKNHGFTDTEKQLMVEEPNTLWAVLKTDLNQTKGKAGTAWTNNDWQQPWWAWDHSDGIASVGALLFMFGFIFPPLWWLGSFWPRRPDHGGKMAIRWQQLNRYFSIGFSIILVIVIIVVAVLYSMSL